jgi:hypothetical protein
MVELYLHSPMCLHGIVLSYIIKYRDNFTFFASYFLIFQVSNFYVCRMDVVLKNTESKTKLTTVSSLGEETGLSVYSGRNISARLLCSSPLVRVQLFAESLTSVSLHAHIYKNTVRR